MLSLIILYLTLLVTISVVVRGNERPPKPTLAFRTTIRVSEAYANAPGAVDHDGCVLAETNLRSGTNVAVSPIVFDGNRGRIRQTNAELYIRPTENLTSIGRWDISVPREWDLTTTSPDGNVTCATEAFDDVICPNGTLPPSCPPTFGSWYDLNPFTDILGMWYPNTSKTSGGGDVYDTYELVDVRPTLLPNDACGEPDTCTKAKCSTCLHRDGTVCTQCPCEGCVMKLNVTRNYTYTVAKRAGEDGTHQLLRYQWTQGIPLTKSGDTPGLGRDCFIFDWSQDWRAGVLDEDFEPPAGIPCRDRSD